MTSLGEIREQLTGPGGAFEVTTDVVNGVEMKVYKDRMGSLREVAQAAANRGDQEFIVQGDQRITYGDFVRQANGVAAALGRRRRRRPRRPGGRAVGQQRRVVPGLLGHRRPGGDPGRAQRLVEDRRDPLRPRRQRGEGPRRRRQALRAHRRPARPGPRPRAHLPDRRRPGRLRRPPHPPLRRAAGRAHRRVPGHADRRGRPRRHLLHVGHDRPAQGRHLHPPEHGGQPPEHHLQLRRHRDGQPRDLWPGRRRPDGGPPHLAPVPRVRLPQQPGRGDDRRREAGHPRGPLRSGQRAPADPGPRRHHLGHRSHDGLAGLRAPRPATTTTPAP